MNSNQTTIIRPGLSLRLVRGWLSSDQEHALLRELHAELSWMQGEIRLFGRAIDEPRLTAWCGDVPYTYSKRVLPKREWDPRLRTLRNTLEAWLENNGIATPHGLNHCLLNYYRSGQDSMGWHRDNERELGSHPVIVSLSLGEPRRFRLRPKNDGTTSPLTFELGRGDLLVMYGLTQTHWEHALLKTRQELGPRMNLTFRSVAEP
ncbi:MAG: alpha-ketoglutarate-dependent dioxygenase AlkB [Gammaproteobacteria bacterium]